MIGAYVVAVLVVGLVLSYLWVIHHFWLRHVFKEDLSPRFTRKPSFSVGVLAVCIRPRISKIPSPLSLASIRQAYEQPRWTRINASWSNQNKGTKL